MNRLFALVISLFFCLAAPPAAWAQFASEQAIEYKVGSDTWERGVFVRLTPSGKQAIIREKPNQFYPEGFQRAYSLDEIRPAGRAGNTAQVRQNAPANNPTATRPDPPANNPTVAQAQAGSPRLGVYAMLGFNPNTQRVGSFELLDGGRYRAHGGREGTWSFNGSVVWLSGPHQEQGFLGEFKTTREGKTHRITLKRRAGTTGRETMIGTNSVD